MARTKQTARKCLVPPTRSKSKLGLGKEKVGARRPTQPLRIKRFQQHQSESQEQAANNQQFSIKFDDQAKCEQNSLEAKIIFCVNCSSIFTSQSKLYSLEQYKNLQPSPNLSDEKKQNFLSNLSASDPVWICQFCLAHNTIPKNYKISSEQNPCFLIQKAEKKGNKQSKDNEIDSKMLIFCIDISGSMELEVCGSKSRLDTVKEAITDEINRIKFENNIVKVGLVTFGSIVQLIGDGKSFKQLTLDSAIYSDFDKIVQECSKIKKFAEPISKSFESLKSKIKSLSVYGSTALGPGLLASIEIASKGGIGSKVIICTDGEANVGIGGSFSPNASQFYQKAANFAKNKRVSVSILSLKGDKCNLKQLGKLSLASGGSILKIQPSALGTEFSKIAKQQILGTSSELVVKIVSQNPKELSDDRTTLKQDIGNFSTQTELTFQFKVLTKQEAKQKPGVDLDLFNQSKVPMQIQLTYVGRDGNKYKQVITDWRQLTENQKQIYQGANFGLFSASVLQRVSAKIKATQFTEAQKIIKGYWSIVEENFSKTESPTELTKFGDRVKKLQSILNKKLGKKDQKQTKKKQKKITKNKSKQKKHPMKPNLRLKNLGFSVIQSDSISESSQQGSQNLEAQDQDAEMSEDEQQQILWKEMRARSRSNSPQAKTQKKAKRS